MAVVSAVNMVVSAVRSFGPTRKKSRQRPSLTTEDCRTRPSMLSPGVMPSVTCSLAR